MIVDEMLASSVDREELRFQAFCADRIVAMIDAAYGKSASKKVLDACAGPGTLSLALAQAIGSVGRVIAVDVSEVLLARLEDKIRKFGIGNIDVHLMDDRFNSFRRNYFDALGCSLAWWMKGDPVSFVREWFRVLRPGGGVFWGVLASDAFQPFAGQLRTALVRYGNEAANPVWMARGDPGFVAGVLRDAGFEGVTVEREVFGYHLRDAMGWWQVVMSGPLCEWLLPMTGSRLDDLRVSHLEDISRQLAADGLWLDVPVLIARGRKPEQ